jgi:hypothetical protein
LPVPGRAITLGPWGTTAHPPRMPSETPIETSNTSLGYFMTL